MLILKFMALTLSSLDITVQIRRLADGNGALPFALNVAVSIFISWRAGVYVETLLVLHLECEAADRWQVRADVFKYDRARSGEPNSVANPVACGSTSPNKAR